ncbi:hypothetical protein N7449_006152 [Penicillium cf. viridicatum]|uniref:Uncharacterized protein n=1 Tax=Penicillium cf. viridicatum TaxID=2972119 RepID=A0A9W9JET4_9EURO|nr:hypothetical protein N7449_006152 [Penicillium cf. viridicatum]
MRSPPPSTHPRHPVLPISLCLRDLSLVGSQGFWGLMIVVAFLATGAGYLLWRRPASKGEDLEEASPKDVAVGEQPKETCEEIPKGDDVKAGPPPEAPETPKTPAPSTTPKGKKKPTTENMVALTTLSRNVAHGVNKFTIDPPAVIAGSVS